MRIYETDHLLKSAGNSLQVVLLGNYPNDRQESMLRFARRLYELLPACGVRCELLQPTPAFGRGFAAEAGLGKFLGYIDKYLVFPWFLRQRVKQHSAHCIFHLCDHSNAVYTRFLQRVPHLVTCNDLLAVRSALGEFPEHRPRFTGRVLQRAILNGLNRAQYVAAISDATRADVLRLSRLSEPQVTRVYMGLNYDYAPMPASERTQWLPRLLGERWRQPYLLHVGGNSWYKNRLGVLRIFAQFSRATTVPATLVMAGKPFTAEMNRFLTEHNLQERVRPIMNCGNEDLRALYSGAMLLLFPSLAEGFGWPILEAQACGCPVLTSGRAPMTEVGGSAAIYCNPDDIAGAAERMLSLWQEPITVRQQRIQASIANAARFSTGQMLASYLAIYRSLAA